MPYVPLGPSNWVDSENCATNEEAGPDAVALSTASFDLYPDQQEAYEESVAKGQIDVANYYRAQAVLKDLSTKSTPFRFRQIVATAALVPFWGQLIDRARRLVEGDTPGPPTEP
jgi:hypothetical protein